MAERREPARERRARGSVRRQGAAPGRKRRAAPWFGTFVGLLASALAIQFAPWPAKWIDAGFLGAVQPLVRSVTAPLVDAVGGSLTAAASLLGLALFAAALIWGRRSRMAALRAFGLLVGLTALAFPLTFGLGYRATDLAGRLGLPAGAPDVAARTYAEAFAVDVLRDARLAVSVERSGGVDPIPAASRCVASFAEAVRMPATGAVSDPVEDVRLPRRVKAVPAGTLLRFGFAGFISPGLLEPHVDAGLPPTAALAVALHELAHAAGFAPEADAEAVGILAGLRCEDPRVRYAAALRLASGLAAALPSERRAAYLTTWPESAVEDAENAAQAAARWRDERLAPVAARAYDAYLRSQGSREGMRDYDRGTALVVHALFRGGDPFGVMRGPN